MDGFEKKNSGKRIDLTTFDLSEFEEYFKEEDAQREAEEKARLQKEEEMAAQQEAIAIEQMEVALEEEQKEKEDLEAKKRELFEQREREEAKKAAEKAAAAVLAARKAEEAKEREQKEISARLLSQADVNNSFNPEETIPEVMPVVDNAKNVEFSKFKSILKVSKPAVNEQEDSPFIEYETEESDSKPKKIGKFVAVICAIIIILAGVAAYIFFGTDLIKDNSADSRPGTTQSSESGDGEGDIVIPFNDMF